MEFRRRYKVVDKRIPASLNRLCNQLCQIRYDNMRCKHGAFEHKSPEEYEKWRASRFFFNAYTVSPSRRLATIAASSSLLPCPALLHHAEPPFPKHAESQAILCIGRRQDRRQVNRWSG